MASPLGRPILTQSDLSNHKASLSNQDSVYWPLYDSAQYPAAGTNQLSLFSTPIGQGTTTAPGASGSKTIADTNMSSAGQLTKGNKFFCTGIELLLFPGINPGRGSVALASAGQFANDVYAIGKSGVLTFTVGSDRKYVQDGPLQVFPGTSRLAVASALSTTNDSDSTTTSVVEEVTYAAWSGEPYQITPVMIDDNMGFQLTLTWPALVTTPSTTAAIIYARLRGYLIRNAQ